MRPYLVVILHVRQQDVTEASLAEHDSVVKASPSDRTDQPFGICGLRRGTRRCGPVAYAYRSESADKDLTIGPVPVTNEIARSLFPPACFRDLICDPFCGWMCCDAKPQYMSPTVPHDQQSIEQVKRDCRHDKQIHSRDAIGMIADKGSPALGRRVSSPDHADFGSEPPSASATQSPPARGSAFFAAPFNHPPTAFPMGERTNVPTACPALLIRSPRNRSSSASVVISSSSPAPSMASASLKTSASPPHSVSYVSISGLNS